MTPEQLAQYIFEYLGFQDFDNQEFERLGGILDEDNRGYSSQVVKNRVLIPTKSGDLIITITRKEDFE